MFGSSIVVVVLQLIDLLRYLGDVFDREDAVVTQIALDVPPVCWKDSRFYTVEEDANGYPVVKK